MDGAPRPEARLSRAASGGLVVDGPGWFVLNAREAQWWHAPEFGDACRFESTVEGASFEDLGVNLRLLRPRLPNCRYHGETGQEDFLVLAGECVAIVEGQELQLGPWDLLHCPPDTLHVFVGAGELPCLLLATGTRPTEETLYYPADPVAARHGAASAEDTYDPAVAYAGCTRPTPRSPRADDLPLLPEGGLEAAAGAAQAPRRAAPATPGPGRPPARLERTPQGGLVPASSGWFAVNAGAAAWRRLAENGDWCSFEGEGDAAFQHLGINLHALLPGQANGRYHGETGQEGFLVLYGSCIAVIEGQERLLRPWDFVHCPTGTRHIFVGAGDGPCLLAMLGARPAQRSILYPVDAVAARHGASVAVETALPAEAYAGRSPSFEIPPRADVLPRWTVPGTPAAAERTER